jgi:AraC family transcriptional regulator
MDGVARLSVATNTVRHASISAGRFVVSDVLFGPGCRLARHAHPHSCVAVVVHGAVEKSFTRATGSACVGTLVTMPPEEPHTDEFGRAGARIIVAETSDDLPVDWRRDWTATILAARLGRELERPDAFTPLAVEGLALELIAVARRSIRAASPGWIVGAREYLHAHPTQLPSVAEIATALGVDAHELAWEFRGHQGESLGAYARRVRIDWAAGQLLLSGTELCALAHEAGFADQSHFTRAFKRQMGVTPGRYRSAHLS